VQHADAGRAMPKRRREVLEKNYEVERIIAARGAGRARQYLVKWEGWSEAENTWEPRSNLHPSTVTAYEKDLARRKEAAEAREEGESGDEGDESEDEAEGEKDIEEVASVASRRRAKKARQEKVPRGRAPSWTMVKYFDDGRSEWVHTSGLRHVVGRKYAPPADETSVDEARRKIRIRHVLSQALREARHDAGDFEATRPAHLIDAAKLAELQPSMRDAALEAETRRLAEAEGLTLVPAATATGLKYVGFCPRASPCKPFGIAIYDYDKGKATSHGYYHTAWEAALVVARLLGAEGSAAAAAKSTAKMAGSRTRREEQEVGVAAAEPGCSEGAIRCPKCGKGFKNIAGQRSHLKVCGATAVARGNAQAEEQRRATAAAAAARARSPERWSRLLQWAHDGGQPQPTTDFRSTSSRHHRADRASGASPRRVHIHTCMLSLRSVGSARSCVPFLACGRAGCRPVGMQWPLLVAGQRRLSLAASDASPHRRCLSSRRWAAEWGDVRGHDRARTGAVRGHRVREHVRAARCRDEAADEAH
jgi:hypothetical protein